MRWWQTLSGMMVLAVMGCGAGADLEETVGSARFALASVGSDGATYKLNGAQISITGPRSMVITDTSMDTLALSLPAGDYEAKLEGNWTLERTDSPTVPVVALMVSPNPLSFTVKAKSAVSVRFLFEVRVGSADVGVSVGNGGWVTGTFTLQNTTDPSGTHRFDNLLGKPIRFTVAYDVGSVDRSTAYSDRVLTVNASSITSAQFSGVADRTLQESLPDGLVTSQDMPSMFSYALSARYGEVWLSNLSMDAWRTNLRFAAFQNAPVLGAIDSEGFPTLDPITFPANFLLQSYGDYQVSAEGAGTMTIVPQ